MPESSRYKHRKTSYKYDYILPEPARQAGYIPYSGPYKTLSEDWQVRRAVWDIVKNGRDKYGLIRKKNQVEIHIIPNYYLFSHNSYNFNPEAIPYKRLNEDGDDDNSPANATEAREETEVELDAEIEVEGGQPEEGSMEEKIPSGQEGETGNAELLRPLQNG